MRHSLIRKTSILKDLFAFRLTPYTKCFNQPIRWCSTQVPRTLPVTVDTDERAVLRETVRRFAEQEIQPLVAKMDEEAKIDPGILTGLFQQGYMGIEVPLEYGGSGMSFIDSLVVIEELSRVDPSIGALVDIHNTLMNRIIGEYGTEEQKNIYLPKFATEAPGSFCLSESGSGSDAFALQTIAKPVENGWRITGNKQWVSNASEACAFIVFATSHTSLKHKGISAFIIDSKTDGLTIGHKYDKLGIRASSTCEVIFDDVFVPHSKVVGEIGKGYKIAISSLNKGRVGIAAQMLGLANGAFDAAFPYLHERVQFEKPIADMQGVKFQYAKLAVKLETARCLVYNTGAMLEADMMVPKEAAIAKYYASTVAEEVASQCVEFFGGSGFTKEYPVEKFFRDSKIGTIYEGTSNMLLETIAKTLQKEFKQ